MSPEELVERFGETRALTIDIHAIEPWDQGEAVNHALGLFAQWFDDLAVEGLSVRDWMGTITVKLVLPGIEIADDGDSEDPDGLWGAVAGIVNRALAYTGRSPRIGAIAHDAGFTFVPVDADALVWLAQSNADLEDWPASGEIRLTAAADVAGIHFPSGTAVFPELRVAEALTVDGLAVPAETALTALDGAIVRAAFGSDTDDYRANTVFVCENGVWQPSYLVLAAPKTVAGRNFLPGDELEFSGGELVGALLGPAGGVFDGRAIPAGGVIEF